MVKVEMYFGFIVNLWICFMGMDKVFVIFVGVSFFMVVFLLLGMIFIYLLCLVSKVLIFLIERFCFNFKVMVWLW